jgi:hypothetical protein
VLGAAGAGVVSSLLLPGKWSKPVTYLGVLPAHAQASVAAYNIIRTSTELVQTSTSLELRMAVFIDPPDSGIAMRASYEIDLGPYPVPGAAQAYEPPITLPEVITTDGAATFKNVYLGSYLESVLVTYEFVDPDVCDTTCQRIDVVVIRELPLPELLEKL